MVLGVCRRVLDEPHDAEDAFQATFLILVKKARSIYGGEVLATWLYGVARRVAIRARADARLRRAREEKGAVEAAMQSLNENREDATELRALIDEELERLPARYRAPLILCDLEGQTHDQAAAQLRCPVGTIKSRLSRGRERLRARLVRRGVAPAAALIATTVAAEAATVIRGPLLELTIGAASTLAESGVISAGTVSAEVATLVNGVMRSMLFTRLTLSAVVLIALVLTAASARVLIGTANAQAPRAGSDASPSQKNVPAGSNEQKNATERPEEPIALGPGVTQFQLKNGLKVILRPIRGVRQTSLVVFYSMGNDHDPHGRTGLAHMLEHVYVTAAAGKTKSRTIDEYLERYSDEWNAQTGDRYTVFATTFPAAKLDEELSDAAARMSDLRITDAEIERERPRMLTEVNNMFSASPPLAGLNNSLELLRPTPEQGRRGGLPAHIKTITADDLRATWKRYYKPRNAIVVLSGDVNPTAALKAIEAHFGNLESGEPAPDPRAPGKPKFGTSVSLNVESLEPDSLPEVCLAYAAPQPGSELYAPYLVLASRFATAAEKLGVAQPGRFPVYFPMLDNPAVLAVSTAAKAGESKEDAIARLERFVAETIAPELRAGEIGNTRLQFALLLGTTDLPDKTLAVNPYGVAFSLGRREQLRLDYQVLNRALDRVTDADLRRVAKLVFGNDRHTGAYIVPK
jgi:zinc protease